MYFQRWGVLLLARLILGMASTIYYALELALTELEFASYGFNLYYMCVLLCCGVF